MGKRDHNTPMPAASDSSRLTPLLRQRGSNHVGMRQFNERVVLQAIRQNGSLPKAELARLTGLTSQTIGLIAARLEEDELLIRHDAVRGRVGQPSIPLALNPDGAFAIGIKIGRRSADCLLVDFTGKVRSRKSLQYPFPDAKTLLPALSDNIQLLQGELRTLTHRLVGVGVAAPFSLGGWHSLLGLSDADAQHWNQLDLAAEVQAMTHLPVKFAKDTSAACVAELVAGRGRDLKSFLYLFVDTFVGGGLVIHSHLHTGVHGNAGAVASLPMNVADGALRAQAPGQLIDQASLWGLEQRFIALGLEPQAAYDDRAMQPPYRTETDAWVERAAVALAHCVVSGTAFLDLDAVVIDGSMSRALLTPLIAQVQLKLSRYNQEGLWPTTLMEGRIGSDARALGGALLPLHANFAPDRDLFLKAAV
jgi:predicted NBD/HSP70 family sugar kinase